MMDIGLANLHRMRDCESRSINAENRGARRAGLRGRPGTSLHEGSAKAAREWGRGGSFPMPAVKAGETVTLADIEGRG